MFKKIPVFDFETQTTKDYWFNTSLIQFGFEFSENNNNYVAFNLGNNNFYFKGTASQFVTYL